jgi:hypothetical protein
MAREAAQQPGQRAEFYCVRSPTKNISIPQFGLGQSSLGHKVGMPTLAASLANAQPGSWAGSFRLREGTWVIVVRDDLVAPDGDVLYDNDDLARDRLMQEVSLGGMQRIYAPDGWAVPGSDPTPLPLLLQDRSDCRLQPVQLPTRLLIFGGGAVGVIVLLIFLALQWQEQQRREDEHQETGPIGSAVKKFEWPPAEKLYERKWEKVPASYSYVENCKGLFAKAKGLELGWSRNGIDCDGASLDIAFNRDKKMYGSYPDNGGVEDTLNSAHQTISGTILPPRGTEELVGESDITKRALHQNWPVDLTRLPDDPPPPPPPNVSDPPPPPPPPWRKRGLTYRGKAPPWEIWGYFDGVPGFMISKISWAGQDWTMEAIIYEQRGK